MKSPEYLKRHAARTAIFGNYSEKLFFQKGLDHPVALGIKFDVTKKNDEINDAFRTISVSIKNGYPDGTRSYIYCSSADISHRGTTTISLFCEPEDKIFDIANTAYEAPQVCFKKFHAFGSDGNCTKEFIPQLNASFQPSSTCELEVDINDMSDSGINVADIFIKQLPQKIRLRDCAFWHTVLVHITPQKLMDAGYEKCSFTGDFCTPKEEAVYSHNPKEECYCPSGRKILFTK